MKLVQLRPAFFVLAVGICVISGAALWLMPGVLSAWLAFSTVFSLFRMARMRREVPAGVSVRDDRLFVGGASFGALGAVTSAFVVPGSGEACRVRLLRRHRPAVELAVRDQAHAVALLRALGLGPTQWAASYVLPPQRGDERQHWVILASFVLVFLATALVNWIAGFRASVPIVSALAVVPFMLLSFLGAFMPRLLVGTDGVTLAFGKRKRFIPHDLIADVEVAPVQGTEGVVLTLTNGEVVAIAVRKRGADPSEVDPLGLFPAQIAERIREARAAAASTPADAPIPGASGSPAEIVRAMRALGRENREGYRIAPISTEQLWQVFESSSADARSRAGAAIALRERLQDGCQRRLRIVAAATAAPDLRAAIERAAEDDDRALEEALSALDAAPPRVAARLGGR